MQGAQLSVLRLAPVACALEPTVGGVPLLRSPLVGRRVELLGPSRHLEAARGSPHSLLLRVLLHLSRRDKGRSRRVELLATTSGGSGALGRLRRRPEAGALPAPSGADRPAGAGRLQGHLRLHPHLLHAALLLEGVLLPLDTALTGHVLHGHHADDVLSAAALHHHLLTARRHRHHLRTAGLHPHHLLAVAPLLSHPAGPAICWT
mmetsp:Transcript_46090/g.122311  ORF Transcript_46090/g.122311 Transcript_46090/m.122311 type:complete len:205 (-) Transcript_46090:166-780(-)